MTHPVISRHLCHSPLQPVTILDWRDDSGLSDNLHFRSDRTATGCTYSRCLGSKVSRSARLT